MAVAAEAREAQEVSEVSVYSTTVGVVLHYYWVVLLCLSVQVAVGVLLFSSSCCSVKLSWRLAVAGYLTEEAVVMLRRLVEGEVLLQLPRVEEGVQLMMKAVVVPNSMLLLADLV